MKKCHEFRVPRKIYLFYIYGSQQTHGKRKKISIYTVYILPKHQTRNRVITI